ncbi:MAG: sodium:proton antiporter [Gammaproteobacteria bacterium]
MVEEPAIIAFAGIAALSIFCQWVAWWVKLPAILFLLLAGILIGPVMGWLDPDALFGDLLFPFVSLSVAVILFEGSLTLKLSDIAGLQTVVRRMVTSGLLVTWAIIALATFWFLDFPPALAFLFGALALVTGPTVIIPMLRTIRPTAKISNILRWEGIVIDPIGALLAVLVYEFIVSMNAGQVDGHTGKVFVETIFTFARILFIGVSIGVVCGHLLGLALRKHWLPEYLHNIATLALVFSVFAVSNQFESEAGLLTVTVMGIWLANMDRVPVQDILDFKESLSIMLISTLFIVLAARIDFYQFRQLGWAAFAVLATIQFVARPLKIALSTWGSSLTWQERALLGWIAPRGIVAAAVAALFSLKLQNIGYAKADLLVPLIFLVIIGTVVLQSMTARFFAKLLGVAEPEPRNFLIIGANPLARNIAVALKKQGIESLLCDTNWNYIRAARMHGLATFYGNASSQMADRRLDLVGLGKLLALSSQSEVNALAVHRYKREFGDKYLFVLKTQTSDHESRSEEHSSGGFTAFGDEVSYQDLSAMIAAGAEMRETKLTDSFDFGDYSRRFYKKAVPMFAVNPKGRLNIFTAEHEIKPAAGWRLLSLVLPEASAEDEGSESGNDMKVKLNE